MDGLTVQAAWIAVLAVLALALVGWRQPARRRPRTRRGATGSGTSGIAVDRLPAEPYEAPGPIRRLLAAVASGGIAVVTGAVLAVVIAFAAAFAVIVLTGMLGR